MSRVIGPLPGAGGGGQRLSRRQALAGGLATGIVLATMGSALAQAAKTAELHIDNFAFTPAELTISVGTTVTWTNRDDIPHTVVEKGLSFKSKVMDTDEQFSRTFDTAGEITYFCSLHPHMTGKIIVKP